MFSHSRSIEIVEIQLVYNRKELFTHTFWCFPEPKYILESVIIHPKITQDIWIGEHILY